MKRGSRGGYKRGRENSGSHNKSSKRTLMEESMLSVPEDKDAPNNGTVHNIRMDSEVAMSSVEEILSPISTKSDYAARLIAGLNKANLPLDENTKTLASLLVGVISALHADLVNDIKRENESLRAETARKDNTIHRLETRVNELTNIVAEQDMYSKRYNLILSGVPTSVGDKQDELQGWFRRLCARVTEKKEEIGWTEPPVIKTIHRINGRKRDTPRDVIIQFDQIADKKTMYRARFDIQKCHPDYKDIFIQGHYNKEINEQRKVLKAVADEARMQYPVMSRSISVYDNILYFGKQRYKIDSLHLLPSNLQPIINGYKENAQAHVFFTKRSPLSNHHPTPFKYDDKEFTCGEQFFMFKKAMRFEDTATAAKIMNTPNPVAQKALGRDIKGFNKDVWHASCRSLLIPGLQARFEQHPHCKQALLDTGKKQLGEATKEAPWGIGYRLSDPECLDPALWRDANIMGNILETIRDNLSTSD